MDGIAFSGQPLNLPARIISYSDQQTRAFGAQLGKNLVSNSVVCFFGDLGAGKTTFIKGLVSTVTGLPPENINSPTYSYLNIYSGPKTVYHFDLYRLSGEDDFLQMDFDAYFAEGGICCIEWAERIQRLLPANTLIVRMTNISVETRLIEINLLLGSNT